jgi:HK97 family phage major capsid protein
VVSTNYRQQPIIPHPPLADVELSERDQARYSITKALLASAMSDWRKAGFEREISDHLQKSVGRAPGPGGFYLPASLSVRAPYATSASTTGGALVATDLLASSFIEVLRAKTVIYNLGPTVLSGLVGNADIPRRATPASAFWVAEGSSITESEGTFDRVSVKAKQIAALSSYSRLMLQQSTPDIEMATRSDLAAILALGLDQAAFSGAGTTSEPLGILNTTGIGSLALGTNGGAISLEAMLDLRGKLTAANVNATGGAFVVNEKTYTALAKLKTSGSGEFLFAPEGNMPGPAGLSVMSIHGCPVITTNLLPSNGTKGTGTNLSTAIFGRWEDLVIANWGAIEILPNPYGAGFNSGSLSVRAMQTVDIAVKHPESFAACTDIITA